MFLFLCALVMATIQILVSPILFLTWRAWFLPARLDITVEVFWLVRHDILCICCNVAGVRSWSNLSLIVSVCIPFLKKKLFPKTYVSPKKTQHFLYCHCLFEPDRMRNWYSCDIWCLFVCALRCICRLVHTQMYYKLLRWLGVHAI